MPELDSLSSPGAEFAPGTATVAPASLFAVAKASIGGEIPRYAARYYCEDEAPVRAAFDRLIEAILSGFAARIVTTDGAARLFGDLGSRRLDEVVSASLERLGTAPSDAPGEEHAPGEHVTARQFGRSVGPMVGRVTAATGLAPRVVHALLILATPLVLAALRDYLNAGSLDAEALRQRLASEYPKVGRMRRNLLRVAPGVLVVLAAVAALAWWSTLRPDPASEKVDRAEAARLSQPEGRTPPPAARSAGVDGLVEFLSRDAAPAEYVLALDRIEFEPGSATLKSSSNRQLAQVALALGAFPDARITVRAHADGDAKEERALAEQRALAVRAALAVFGVDIGRTDHAGPGETSRPGHPVEARVTRK
jgi:outer membrane protein OmpA-like peptidoglycan-associated protein